MQQLRKSDPGAKLAAAQLSIARDYGFPSWRALKADIERRQATNTDLFFEACKKGDAETLRRLLVSDPDLVRATPANARHSGGTGSHEAAKRRYVDTARVLLEHGAWPSVTADTT